MARWVYDGITCHHSMPDQPDDPTLSKLLRSSIRKPTDVIGIGGFVIYERLLAVLRGTNAPDTRMNEELCSSL